MSSNGSSQGAWDIECTRYLKPQIRSVGLDTDLVLLTGGGNDVNFAEIVQECFYSLTRDPGACRSKVTEARSSIPDVQAELETALDALRSRMRSDAKVGVIGYPFLSNTDDYDVTWNILGFERDRYNAGREVRELGREGDTAQQDAVDAANVAAGLNFATFVNIKDLFEGHEPNPFPDKETPGRWMSEFDTRIPAEWYHFNATGHEKLAEHLGVYGTFGTTTFETGKSVDLVFVVDTTGSMGPYINQVKANALAILDELDDATADYRVAVVSYRDRPGYGGSSGDYPSRVDLDFSTATSEIETAIDSLMASGGGDGPETVWSGMMAGIGLDWRPGVTKTLIQFGDAPPKDR